MWTQDIGASSSFFQSSLGVRFLGVGAKIFNWLSFGYSGASVMLLYIYLINMVESADAHKREENKRLKAGTGPSIEEQQAKIGGELRFTKNPAYIKERQTIFEELFATQQKKYEGK